MRVARRVIAVAVVASMLGGALAAGAAEGLKKRGRRTGPVRVEGHSLVDDNGPFLGLGVSYFTALWRAKHDRARLEADLEFLARCGFNYYRMLSMVGYYPAWEGLEITPAAGVNRKDKRIEAWPDYWAQLRGLVDLAYDKYGLRTQITIFADAQLMPEKSARIEHMRRMLEEVVAGREQKIILLEVANEAWQNGFAGKEGVADLREFAKYLGDRTKVPVAITSNHEDDFEELYAGGVADIATWHFSRDRRTDEGWKPVYDCWELGEKKGFPPVSSNEPIGPGSSVDAERDPVKIVAAAAFAYAAKLPMYVYHSEAGVFGRSRFQEMPGVDRFAAVMRLLPPDLAGWERNDGKGKGAVFTAYAGGQADRYWPEVKGARDGCVRNVGGRKGERFVCVAIGIKPEGLELEAREAVELAAHDPLTGEVVKAAKLRAGERVRVPGRLGALIVVGKVNRGD